jgi:hypothetical protein
MIGLIGFYGLFHLMFGIQFSSLWKPYGVVSALTLLMFSAMYWANKSSRHMGNDGGRVFLVLGTYMCSTSLVGTYYSAQLGLMPTEDVIPFSVFLTAGLSISCLLAYYTRKRHEGKHRSEGGHHKSV